jgi:hypothetical protein
VTSPISANGVKVEASFTPIVRPLARESVFR